MLRNPLRLAHTTASSLCCVVQRRMLVQTAIASKSFLQLVQEIKSTNKNIHPISPNDLHTISSTTSTQNPRLPPHVIDVRERHEVEATGTIPRAIVLPRGVLERDIGKFLKQDDPKDVVVYCAGGMRSVLAAESLVRLGYGAAEAEEDIGKKQKDGSGGDVGSVVGAKDRPRVWSLDEGIDGWIKNGYEVEKKTK
ncbi:hypothetical protein EDD11_006894 [Mortierella claussenii]|nr:hypothetical protein EDD11_006894 [Mortierella claussenii]